MTWIRHGGWAPLDECDDGNPCTDDACVPGVGCTSTQNGEACDDGDPCTEQDTCSSGECAGGPVSCDDKNPCTADTCGAESGTCTHLVQAGVCDDGDPCTAGDTCAGTTCVGSTLPCDDGNPCTDDACNPATGCTHIVATHPCDDGNACTEGDTCAGGTCAGTAVTCSDGNPCTTDACNPAAGCVYSTLSGVPCSDGDSCTAPDVCSSGACVAGPVSCDDGNPCTLDGCNKVGACEHIAETDGASCDDGNACTVGDACSGGTCGGAAKCNDGNPCTTDTCNAGVCSNAPDGSGVGCNDGDSCTFQDVCAGGECKGIPASTFCDDGNVCTNDVCLLGVCSNVSNTVSCSDGNACTTGDKCNGGVCVGTPKDCNDDNVCTNDSCLLGACAHTLNSKAKCSDGDACTEGDSCVIPGTCKGTVVDCNDSNPCTTDTCSPTQGCQYANVSTGTTCSFASCQKGFYYSTDTCQSGVCVNGGVTSYSCGDQVCLAACEDGTSCASDCTLVPKSTLVSGLHVKGNTSSGVSQVQKYSCTGQLYPGREGVYEYVSPAAGTLSVTLSGSTGYLAAFVIEKKGAGCNPNDCIGEKKGNTTGTYTVKGATTYCVVVDYFNDPVATSAYELVVTHKSTAGVCSALLYEDWNGAWPGAWTKSSAWTLQYSTSQKSYSGYTFATGGTTSSPTLESPRVITTGCSGLKAKFKWAASGSAKGYSAPSLHLYYSTNGGTSWQPVKVSGSCLNSCGAQSIGGDGCACDDLCVDYGDCCTDASHWCAPNTAFQSETVPVPIIGNSSDIKLGFGVDKPFSQSAAGPSYYYVDDIQIVP